MDSNDKVGVVVAQPKEEAERDAVASGCCAALELKVPMLVDDIDNRAGQAYSAFPDRFYMVDRAGTIAFRSGRGPYGFDIRELEQSLVMLLLDQAHRAPARR